MRFFSRKLFFRTTKKIQEGDDKKNSEKAGDTDIFLNTKWLLENWDLDNIFCWKNNLCGEFSAKFRKFKIFEKNKKEKSMQNFFKKNYTRNSENKFLEGLTKCYFCQKKEVNLSCSKEHDWKNKNKKKKGRNNKGDKTKTVLQKRDEQLKKQKKFFKKTKNKQRWFFKKKYNQRKLKRERESK